MRTKEKNTKSKKAPKAKAHSNGKVDRSMGEAPASERKVALVKALKALKAVTATSGVTVEKLSEKLGYTKFDVYGLVNGTSGKAGSNPKCLHATGHVKVADLEDGRAFYLTAKGKATNFSEAPFAKPAKE